MKKELQLSDICSYLPYGLKVKCGKCVRSIEGIINEMTAWVDEEGLVRRLYDDEGECFCSPILRNMSDLTKPITHKGETFVPIVKMANSVWSNDEWVLKDNHAVMYFAEGGYTHVFYDKREGIGMFVGLHQNGTNSLKIESCPIHSDAFIDIIDWLNKHLFDYRGLIDAGLAISVTDMKEGVYEQ